jgi:tRNA (guanine-N7-)-methyltransferase
MPEPLVSLSDHPEGFTWAALFGRMGPVEVEIGTGKGTTLVRLAGAHPEVDFLGIEYGTKYVRLTRARLAKAGTTNVRLVAAEAEWVLARHVPAGSVRRFHVYFPDPWPKKRHGKRRLFRPSFPPLLRRCLAPGGDVRIATDHAVYWEQIREVMEAGGFRPDPGAAWEPEPLSSFDRKYRDQGRTIHRAAFGFAPPA